LKFLLGLLGKLLEILIYHLPIRALALGLRLGSIILHAFLVVLHGGIHVIHFAVVKPPEVRVAFHCQIATVLLLLESIESMGTEHALIFLVAGLVQLLDQVGVTPGCRIILKLFVDFRPALVPLLLRIQQMLEL
jgi:hypothetical protein